MDPTTAFTTNIHLRLVDDVDAELSVGFGANALYRVPEQSAELMRFLAHWSHLEVDMAWLVIDLMGQGAPAIADMHRRLRSSQALTVWLESLAKTLASPETRPLTNVFFEMFNQLKPYRNAVAHSAWGLLMSDQKTLVLIEPWTQSDYLAATARYSATGWPSGSPQDLPQLNRSKTRILRASDVDALMSAVAEAGSALHALKAAGGIFPNLDFLSDQMQLPHVQAVLAKLDSGGKKKEARKRASASPGSPENQHE